MNKAKVIHEAIRRFYLNRGRTLEQWQAVSEDPAKFNLVWRRSLGLSGEGLPPRHFRNVNPETGEVLQ